MLLVVVSGTRDSAAAAASGCKTIVSNSPTDVYDKGFFSLTVRTVTKLRCGDRCNQEL